MDIRYERVQVGSVFFGALMILALLILGYLLKPVLSALSLTLVLAYLLHPVVGRLEPYLGRRWLAITVTFFFVLIPLFLFTVVLTTTIASELIAISKTDSMKEVFNVLGENFKGYLKIPDGESLPTLSYSSFTTVGGALTQGAGYLIAFFKVLGGFFLQAMLGVFLTIYVLIKQDSVFRLYNGISNQKIKDFFAFVDEAFKQVVYSMLLTSVFTGVLATIIYMIFKVPFSVLWGTTTGLVSLIPILGTWLVYLPIAVYFYLQGQTFLSLLFLGICIVFITTLPDIAVRPIIASKKIDIGLIVLGFLTGTLAFGTVGFIIGPLIIIAWTGFVKIFLLHEDSVK